MSVCLFVSNIYVKLNLWPQRTCVGLLKPSNIMNKGGVHGARGHYYIHVYHYNTEHADTTTYMSTFTMIS